MSYIQRFSPLQDYFLILLFFNPLGNYYDVWIEVEIKLYFFSQRAESPPQAYSMMLIVMAIDDEGALAKP